MALEKLGRQHQMQFLTTEGRISQSNYYSDGTLEMLRDEASAINFSHRMPLVRVVRISNYYYRLAIVYIPTLKVKMQQEMKG